MKHRTVKIHRYLEHIKVGPFNVKQPLPEGNLRQVSPFILLHHAGPDTYAPGVIRARLSPHPHRGFEPVTFLFSGKIHHRDSTGSEGFLESGDVQWMTAGSGIIHSEGPSAEFAAEGGVMELIQLWVNLPRENKMTLPKYQDIKKASIPVLDENGFEIRLVAGAYKGLKGPASTFTPILAMMIHFDAGKETELPLPANFNSLVYVLDGTVESSNQLIEKYNLGVFEKDGESVQLKSNTAGRLLFLAGEPINEPVVSHGPFVMNYPAEIKQAILDFEMGKMGVLES